KTCILLKRFSRNIWESWQKPMKKTIVRMTLIGPALLVLLVVLFMMFALFQRISYNIYDFDMRQTMNSTPHESIIVVAINEDSLREYGQFPWERDVFVPFLDHVSQAKAVVFDIMFNTDSKNEDNDLLLAEALARHDNV